VKAGFLERPGCRLYYEMAGSGPAIVFAHGLGGNHMSWWQQVAHFAPHHTCVSYAHRGFTPSGAVPGEGAPDAYVDDLAALIDSLGLDDVRLVAQSMGGWSCLGYALEHPGRVRSLVLASTSGRIDPAQAEGFGAQAFAQWLSKATAAAEDLERRGILSAGGERMAREQPALAQLYRQINQLTPAEFKAAVRSRIRKLRDQPPALLGTLPMPVLFHMGEEDIVYPAAAGPALARYAKRGRAITVPQAGHSVYFERAARFNRDIEQFLKESA
jgi:pimeloyl-ACP methyl ester carboxylesterase